ncbi:hypothetical protein KSF_052670 [Reticulibacter mediterranei]|uniref:Uncharacterized protein n=2 Tax=Reticulibacter mediterranei TaxID=2778369 RepID=A0A8J3IGT3_9CHLR|nr:hypothetical protein KSF_052670 [Reticulibacter mediterranei]
MNLPSSPQKESDMNAYSTLLDPTDTHHVVLIVEQQFPGDEEDCMHLVRIPNSGYLVLCNAPTGEDCAACGRPTCPAHFSGHTLTTEQGEQALCYPCSQLPPHAIKMIRSTRLTLNQQSGDTPNG